MKKLLCVLLMVVCSFGVVSCGGGDDDGDSANSITGSATLQVLNQTPVAQEIYFDGSYIGDVVANSSRSWNVPAGQHVVTGHDNTYGDATGTYTFTAGRVTTVTYSIRSARNAAAAGSGTKSSAAFEE